MAKEVNAKAPRGWFKKLYWGFVMGENSLGHLFLLVIRLYWGALLVNVGIKKLFNIDPVIASFTNLNIPYPSVMAYTVGIFEFLGGVSLFIGFISRFFSLVLSVIFIVAFATAHKEALQGIFSNPSLFIQQDPFLFLFVALTVLCFGPGLFSIDYWLERRAYGRPL